MPIDPIGAVNKIEITAIDTILVAHSTSCGVPKFLAKFMAIGAKIAYKNNFKIMFTLSILLRSVIWYFIIVILYLYGSLRKPRNIDKYHFLTIESCAR